MVAVIFLSSHLLVSLMCEESFFGWGDLPQTHSKVRIHQKQYRQGHHPKTAVWPEEVSLPAAGSSQIESIVFLLLLIHFSFWRPKQISKQELKRFWVFFLRWQGSLHGRKQEFYCWFFSVLVTFLLAPLIFFFFCRLKFLSMLRLSLIITFIFSTSGIHLNPCLMHR